MIQNKLTSINLWHFVWFAVGASVLFTVIMSLILRGRITYDYLITGSVVSLIVASLVIYLIQQLQAIKKRAEEALQRSETRFHQVISSISDHIYVAEIVENSHWNFQYTSPNAEMLTGYPRGKFIADPSVWISLIHPDDRAAAMAQADRFARGQNSETEYRFIRANGDVIWVRDSGRVQQNIDRQSVTVYGVVSDITERKQVEEMLKTYQGHLETLVEARTSELTETNSWLQKEIAERKQTEKDLQRAKEAAENANRAKSDFLANMSHELRTPLNHIIGFTELVLDRHFGELNDVQEEYLNDVLDSGRHLLSLINDILDLSKVESGTLDLKPSDVDLKSLLEQSLNMVKEKVMNRRMRLSVEVADLPETITADERKLKQIVYNLLSNAIKFTPDGGSVTLSAETLSCVNEHLTTSAGYDIDVPMPMNPASMPSGDWITFAVKDSGIGLKQEDLLRIFSPFEQVESSISRRYQGTGLGLTLTRRFVELHGGWIWAESDGEGRGSIFRCIIPVSRDIQQTTELVQESRAANSGRQSGTQHINQAVQ